MTDHTQVVHKDASSALRQAIGAVRVAAWLAFASGIMMGPAAFLTGAGGPISLMVLGVPMVIAGGFALALRELRRESRRGVGIVLLLATLSTVWVVNNLFMVLVAIAAWFGAVQAWRWSQAVRSRAT
jgi:hypothetical protein